MTTNREKNTAFAQRQETSKRPAPRAYDFAALDLVVRNWIKPQDELSPFVTCNS